MKALFPIGLGLSLGGFILTVGGCATAPTTPIARDELKDNVGETLTRLKQEDPGFSDFLDRADGYVIFPTVGKGAAGVGGAYGRGEVFERGRFVGYADISQATIGAQVGGQSFSEVIAFETPFALQQFERGQVAFDANVSAVAVTSGAALSAKYEHGVAVFVEPQGGLMIEASVGGQGFSFEPE